MSLFKASLVGVILSIAASPCYASVNCTFPVESTSVGVNGNVFLNLTTPSGSKAYQICNVINATNTPIGPSATFSVSSDQCKVFYTTFLTAKATGRSLAMSWEIADCNSTPASGVPSPYFPAGYGVP